jgi:hypothetical protein
MRVLQEGIQLAYTGSIKQQGQEMVSVTVKTDDGRTLTYPTNPSIANDEEIVNFENLILGTDVFVGIESRLQDSGFQGTYDKFLRRLTCQEIQTAFWAPSTGLVLHRADGQNVSGYALPRGQAVLIQLALRLAMAEADNSKTSDDLLIFPSYSFCELNNDEKARFFNELVGLETSKQIILLSHLRDILQFPLADPENVLLIDLQKIQLEVA